MAALTPERLLEVLRKKEELDAFAAKTVASVAEEMKEEIIASVNEDAKPEPEPEPEPEPVQPVQPELVVEDKVTKPKGAKK